MKILHKEYTWWKKLSTNKKVFANKKFSSNKYFYTVKKCLCKHRWKRLSKSQSFRSIQYYILCKNIFNSLMLVDNKRSYILTWTISFLSTCVLLLLNIKKVILFNIWKEYQCKQIRTQNLESVQYLEILSINILHCLVVIKSHRFFVIRHWKVNTFLPCPLVHVNVLVGKWL